MTTKDHSKSVFLELHVSMFNYCIYDALIIPICQAFIILVMCSARHWKYNGKT